MVGHASWGHVERGSLHHDGSSDLHGLVDYLALPCDVVLDNDRLVNESWSCDASKVLHRVILVVDSVVDWTILLRIVDLRIEKSWS